MKIKLSKIFPIGQPKLFPLSACFTFLTALHSSDISWIQHILQLQNLGIKLILRNLQKLPVITKTGSSITFVRTFDVYE